ALPAFEPSDRVTVISAPQENSGTQTRISVVGDVNGDGIKDLGLTQLNGNGFIFFGSTTLSMEIDLQSAVAANQAVQIFPGTLPATGSFTMVPVGDLTGDGIDDLAVSLSADAGVIVFLKGQATWPKEINLFDFPQVFCRIHGLQSNYGLAS